MGFVSLQNLKDDAFRREILDMKCVSSNPRAIGGQRRIYPKKEHESGDWDKAALQESGKSIDYRAYCQLNPFREGNLDAIAK